MSPNKASAPEPATASAPDETSAGANGEQQPAAPAKQPSKPAGGKHYEVGYCRPPRKNQWPRGQSGNPKGRRKGCKNEATLLRELLDDTKLSLRVNGKVKRISVREAILRGIIEDAVKRNLKSAQFVLNRHRAVVEGETVPPELSQDDAEVLKDYLKRHAASKPGKE